MTGVRPPRVSAVPRGTAVPTRLLRAARPAPTPTNRAPAGCPQAQRSSPGFGRPNHGQAPHEYRLFPMDRCAGAPLSCCTASTHTYQPGPAGCPSFGHADPEPRGTPPPEDLLPPPRVPVEDPSGRWERTCLAGDSGTSDGRLEAPIAAKPVGPSRRSTAVVPGGDPDAAPCLLGPESHGSAEAPQGPVRSDVAGAAETVGPRSWRTRPPRRPHLPVTFHVERPGARLRAGARHRRDLAGKPATRRRGRPRPPQMGCAWLTFTAPLAAGHRPTGKRPRRRAVLCPRLPGRSRCSSQDGFSRGLGAGRHTAGGGASGRRCARTSAPPASPTIRRWTADHPSAPTACRAPSRLMWQVQLRPLERAATGPLRPPSLALRASTRGRPPDPPRRGRRPTPGEGPSSSTPTVQGCRRSRSIQRPTAPPPQANTAQNAGRESG